MRTLFSTQFFLLLAFCLSLCAREPAQVRLYCLSLWFPPAQTSIGGHTSVFELSSAGGSESNGELAPLFDQRFPTHGAFFRLHDPSFPSPLTGQIAFDTPEFVDANENGWDDFFESSQGVETTTTFGFFTTAVDGGSVTATWSRAPGSVVGSCRLQLRGDIFGQLPEFTHAFELIEYTGTFAYTTTTNEITGLMVLEQSAYPASTLAGNLTLTREATNRFDQVRLHSGSLTNAAGEELFYMSSRIGRDVEIGTNYFGLFEFSDGDLSTSAADYLDWLISIDDPNDTNENGIPDLTDDPPAAPLDPPRVELGLSENQLLLSIRGGAGRTFDIEEADSLSQTNWTSALSVTVTSDPQIVELPLPETTTRFWRLRAR
jgi:hypothetical protein